MFEKNDIVFHEALGVCVISDIQKLSVKKEEGIPYYILKKIKNKEKVAYVPVDNHKTLLRELISLEAANEIIESVRKKENAAINDSLDADANKTILKDDFGGNSTDEDSECEQADCEYLDIEVEEAKYVILNSQKAKKNNKKTK